jgi:hypothetical protein
MEASMPGESSYSTAPAMSRLKRFCIGGAGGLAPVVLFFACVDFQAYMNNAPLATTLGYVVRALALFLIGGFVAYLHNNEDQEFKIFEIGLGAPAVLAGLIATNAANSNNNAPDKRLAIAMPPAAEQIMPTTAVAPLPSQLPSNLPGAAPTTMPTAMPTASPTMTPVAAPAPQAIPEADSGRPHASRQQWALDWLLPSANAQTAQAQQEQQNQVKQLTVSPKDQFLQGLLGIKPKNTYYVQAGTHKDLQAAQNQAREINQVNKQLRAEVVQPLPGEPNYAVVLGSNLNKDEAIELRRQAVRSGLPKQDTEIRALPEKQ